MQSCWATFLMALVGFGLVLNKERFPKLAYGINIALLTFPIVAIPGEEFTLGFWHNTSRVGADECICACLSTLRPSIGI